jgi:hypothetical protein
MNKTPRGIRVIFPPGFFEHTCNENWPFYWEKTRPLDIRKSPVAVGKLPGLKGWPAKDTRQLLVHLAHNRSLGIDFYNTAVESAAKELDGRELRIFINNLARKRKNNDAGASLNTVICYLWYRRIDLETPNGVYQFLGGLRHWSTHAASALLTLYLHQRGVRGDKLSPEAYQKRVERLRRRGITLDYAEDRLVVGGKWTAADATATIRIGKARQTVQVTAFSR